MVDAHRLAHHLGALGVFLVVLQSHLAQGVEHAPVHGLEPVAGIGQRAPDDHRHRVVEIGAAHLLFDVDGDEVGAAAGRRTTFKRELGILIVCHRGFSGPPQGGKKVPEKAGPGCAGCASILPVQRGFQQGAMKANKSLFCLILCSCSSVLPGAAHLSRRAAGFCLGSSTFPAFFFVFYSPFMLAETRLRPYRMPLQQPRQTQHAEDRLQQQNRSRRSHRQPSSGPFVGVGKDPAHKREQKRQRPQPRGCPERLS